MHSLGLPAGSAIRLTATARAAVGVHRWSVRVIAADSATADATPRLNYGSQIGERDREQRIDIPAQAVDCRLEVSTRHATAADGWRDGRVTIADDTPNRLDIGFSNPASPAAHEDEVLLSFAFSTADPQT